MPSLRKHFRLLGNKHPARAANRHSGNHLLVFLNLASGFGLRVERLKTKHRRERFSTGGHQLLHIFTPASIGGLTRVLQIFCWFVSLFLQEPAADVARKEVRVRGGDDPHPGEDLRGGAHGLVVPVCVQLRPRQRRGGPVCAGGLPPTVPEVRHEGRSPSGPGRIG